MVIRPSRPSRFQKSGLAPRPVARPVAPTPLPARPARPAQREAEPASEPTADVAPPLIAAPDETDTGSVPVVSAREQAPAPKQTARAASVQSLEALVRESKAALQERDEALAKAAELETRVEELTALQARAGEIQDQLAAVMAERDRNAEALAEAQQRIESLKPLETETATLKQKLAASERARVKVAQEHAKLKSRVALLEGQLKELMEHFKASEGKRKKAETALANAKETRNEYLFRLQAIQAVAQGETPPSRSKVAAEAEKADEAASEA